MQRILGLLYPITSFGDKLKQNNNENTTNYSHIIIRGYF